jgi:uncharacterized protein
MGCDVAFSDAVKKMQEERGSRAIYERVERSGGFESEVNEELERFLATIDTAFLATASKDGQPYVQHRGGPKGFLRALDAHTIGFLDFAGNRQYVTTGNLTENDRVCLFLVDYENRRRVKVWGTAKSVPLSDDLARALDTPGYRARREQAILINVTAWDVNCPQHIPQKLDAAEVKTVIDGLTSRIRELEEENERLREG